MPLLPLRVLPPGVGTPLGCRQGRAHVTFSTPEVRPRRVRPQGVPVSSKARYYALIPLFPHFYATHVRLFSLRVIRDWDINPLVYRS